MQILLKSWESHCRGFEAISCITRRPIALDQWFLTFFLSFLSRKSYQIYPQYTQSCSFIENTKLTTSYSLEWFRKIYIGCNLRFNKCTHLKDKIYPQVKNHCSREQERHHKVRISCAIWFRKLVPLHLKFRVAVWRDQDALWRHCNLCKTSNVHLPFF